VSDLEVEALSTAMANKLKLEVYFHLVILDYAYLYWLLVLSLILTDCYTAFLHKWQLANLQQEEINEGNEEETEELEDMGSAAEI